MLICGDRSVSLLSENIGKDGTMDHVELSLQIIANDDVDNDTLDAQVRLLQNELEDISAVENIMPVTEDALEDGAKGLGEALGKLALSVMPDGVAEVLGFLNDWIQRSGNNRVEIEAENKDGARIKVAFDPDTTSLQDIERFASALQTINSQA